MLMVHGLINSWTLLSHPGSRPHGKSAHRQQSLPTGKPRVNDHVDSGEPYCYGGLHGHHSLIINQGLLPESF